MSAFCPRHGGTWGEDDTCILCGFHEPAEIVQVTILLHRDDVADVKGVLDHNDLTLLSTEEPYTPEVSA